MVRAQTSTINGTVFNSSRQPVKDLWVELLDEVDSVQARTRTDANGRYTFSRLSNGVFQVKVITYGTPLVSETRRVLLTSSWQNAGTRSVNEIADFYLKQEGESRTDPRSSGTIFAQEVPEPARRAYEQALALLDAGKDPDAGMARLIEAVSLFPDYYLALERLGIEQGRRGQHQEVLNVLSKAIQVNPSGHDSYYALGVSQFRLRKHAESAESLKRMLTLAPGSPNVPFASYFLGLALLRGGKPTESEPQLLRAIEIGGKNIPSDVHMALAQIYSNTKRYKEAIKELELYLKETPDAEDTERIRAIISQLRAKRN